MTDTPKVIFDGEFYRMDFTVRSLSELPFKVGKWREERQAAAMRDKLLRRREAGWIE